VHGSDFQPMFDTFECDKVHNGIYEESGRLGSLKSRKVTDPPQNELSEVAESLGVTSLASLDNVLLVFLHLGMMVLMCVNR